MGTGPCVPQKIGTPRLRRITNVLRRARGTQSRRGPRASWFTILFSFCAATAFIDSPNKSDTARAIIVFVRRRLMLTSESR
jgi:hypothetical protein